MPRSLSRAWLLCAVLLACPLSRAQLTIHLQEAIGRDWPESVVSQRIRPDQPFGLSDVLVLEEGGQIYRTQRSDIEMLDDTTIGAATLWFRTDLKADADRRLIVRKVAPGEQVPDTDLRLESTEDGLVIRNAATAVRLPAKGVVEGDLAGPLLGVRLPSGVWTGASTVTPPDGAGAVTRETRILDFGPIFVRVRVHYTWANGGSYSCDVTLRAGESIVRIDERYETAGSVAFALGGDAAPTTIASENNTVGSIRTDTLDYAAEASHMAFAGWDLYLPDRAHAIDLRNDETGDFLGIVSTDADWLPNPNKQMMSLTSAPERVLQLSGPLADGHRHWGFLVGKTTDYPKPGLDVMAWWSRHVAVPLEKVVNWQLTWPGMDQIAFPHTFFSQQDVPDIRARLQASEPIQDYMKSLLTPPKRADWTLARSRYANRSAEQQAAFDDYESRYRPRGGIAAGESYVAAAYLYTGNDVYLEQLADDTVVPGGVAFGYLDTLIDVYLDGVGPFEMRGRMAHMHVADAFMLRYLAWEFLLGSEHLDVAQKRRLLSKLAFAVYLMHEAEWQPAIHMPDGSRPEGYPQGTANMKNCAYSCRAITAAMLTNHPELPHWIDFAMKEMTPHMEWTIHPSGAMLESPFYTSRDTIRYVPFWTAMIRAGVNPETPAIARTGRGFSYLVDMLTPPDPRMGNRRVYHAIGRSSPGVIDPTFMIGAQPWGAADPEHGQRMRWAWEAQGQPSPDVMETTGGRNVGLTLLAFAKMLEFPKPETPPLRSRRYEGFGVIMRGGVETDHESNVMFRHDPFAWDLYPPNNGAVYFYAKGVPLLPRFGGYWMTNRKQVTGMSAPFGNRVLYGSGDQSALGRTTAYALLGDVADYAAGVSGDKRWERRVLYSKDLSRDDGIYLLVCDDVRKAAEGSAVHWWIMTRDIQPDGVGTPGVVPINMPGGDTEWIANIGHNWAKHAAAMVEPATDGGKGVTLKEEDAALPTLEAAPKPRKIENGPPKLTGPQHRFTGQFGVDLDMYIIRPEATRIVVDAAGVGPRLPYCVNPGLYDCLELIRIEPETAAPTATFLTLLAPRLPDAAAATYTGIADGRGVRIIDEREMVSLFLADASFDFRDDAVSFSGQSGSARVAADRLRLSVAGGRIAADGVTLEAEGYAAILLEADTAILWADDPASVTVTMSGRWAGRDADLTRVTVDAGKPTP